MSTTIRLSDETKDRLAALKREDESFDEALARVLEEHGGRDFTAGFGILSDSETSERVRESHAAMNRGIDERVREIADDDERDGNDE